MKLGVFFMKGPSEEVKVKMFEFFLKTSVPRILAEEREKKEVRKSESKQFPNG